MLIYKYLKIFIISITICTFCNFIRPVEIIAVHKESILLVENFPKYAILKLLWWKSNKEFLNKNFGIGIPDVRGNFSFVVHDFGAGYKVDTHTDQDSDLLCFYEMKEQANCLVKDPLFAVNNYNPKKLNFTYY